MSNFICDICAIVNVDSETGYIEGCAHYHPDKGGRYQVTLKTYNNPHVADGVYYTTRYYENGEWQVPNFEEIVQWSKIK